MELMNFDFLDIFKEIIVWRGYFGLDAWTLGTFLIKIKKKQPTFLVSILLIYFLLMFQDNEKKSI